MPVDLSAPTAERHHWTCCMCKFETRSVEEALKHCESRSGDFPDAEHLLHEMEDGWQRESRGRNRARRVISCRDDEGRALNARVTQSRWVFVDGSWEIRGVTVIGRRAA